MRRSIRLSVPFSFRRSSASSQRVAMLAAMLAVSAPAFAGDLSLDLNKLEANGGKCRTTLVIGNQSGAGVDKLKADLVVFGKDGVVARRLAVELGPVANGKTVIRTFDIPETDCAAIGSVLLNDIPQCTIPVSGAAKPCVDVITLNSRTGTRFFK